MSAAARATPPASGEALIEHCQADFIVTAPRGPMSTPAGLLNTLRQELLPVLSEVLEAPEWQGIDLTVTHIDIDLGDWPDDPVWSDVRYAFAQKLRASLQEHLRQTAGPAAATAREMAGATAGDPPATKAPAGIHQTAGVVALPDARHGTSETMASLADREIVAALEAFQQWLRVQAPDLAVAEILSHLAAHPAQVRGLILWQAASPLAQQKALPLSTSKAAVSQAAARLAAHADPANGTPTASLQRNTEPGQTSSPGHELPNTRTERPENNTADLAHEDHPRAVDQPGEVSPEPDPEQPTPNPSVAEYDTAAQNAQPARPTDTTTEDANTATTQQSSAYGRAPKAMEQPAEPKAPGPSAPGAAGNAAALAPPGTRQSVLARMGRALSTDTPEGLAMRAAAARLEKSFRHAGVAEGAARAATLPILARLQTLLPTTAPSAGAIPVDDQTQESADTPAGYGADLAGNAAGPDISRTNPGRSAARSSPAAGDISGPDAVSRDGHAKPSGGQDERAKPSAGSSSSDRTASAARAAGHVPSDKPISPRSTPQHSASNPNGFAATPARSEHTESEKADPPPQHEGARPQDGTASLQALAMWISSDPTKATVAHLAQAFADTPDRVFDLAEQAGDLATLARLFTHATITPRPALTLLPPDRIRRLAAENPVALTQAVSSLSQAEAMTLAQSLLPKQAALLRAQIEALQDNALAPRFALQQAVQALLENAVVDIEALAVAVPADAPQGETAPSSAPAAMTAATAQDAQISPAAPAPETPLETVLALSGLTAAEIDRVLARATTGAARDDIATGLTKTAGKEDRAAPRHPESRGTATPAANVLPDAAKDPDRVPGLRKTPRKDRASDMSKGSGRVPASDQGPSSPATEHGRDDAALHAHLTLLAGLEEGLDMAGTGDMLRLIWQLWPQHSARGGPDFTLPLATITAQIAPTTRMTDRLEAALDVLEPDPEKHLHALRTVAARLAYSGEPDPTGLRRTTRATIETLIAHRSTRPVPERHGTPETQRALYTKNPDLAGSDPATPGTTPGSAATPAAREETLLITENAGLVLLHPFFALLFDRMEIEREGKALRRDDLPRALGALQFLAGDARLNDPLHCVLLGVNPALRLPDPQPPDDSTEELMTGLLRSVIDRWGRLGKTSPDGLRETFLQRSGSLRFDEAGSRLQVASGPFDMLLDVLPWAIGTVALPWMPLPCRVAWREDNHV